MWVKRLVRIYFNSVAVILVVTALAKVDLVTHYKGLWVQDESLFGVSKAWFILIASVVELATAAALLSKLEHKAKAGIIVWLVSLFLWYRWSSDALVSSHRPCDCLGDIPTIVGLSSNTVNYLIWCILIWFSAGAGLIYLFERRWPVDIHAQTKNVANHP